MPVCLLIRVAGLYRSPMDGRRNDQAGRPGYDRRNSSQDAPHGQSSPAEDDGRRHADSADHQDFAHDPQEVAWHRLDQPYSLHTSRHARGSPFSQQKYPLLRIRFPNPESSSPTPR